MKKDKPVGSFTKLGIGILIVLAVIMIVNVYASMDDEPFYLKILEGVLHFGFTFLGAGIIMLAFFVAFYGISSITESLFYHDKEDKTDHKEIFLNLAEEFSIMAYIASYIYVLLKM